ncbi:MAG: hypothetical protein GY870_16405, partial [archaeon]|nr:hypothetical protein [archaeon]
ACSVIPPFLEIKPDDHFLGIIRAWNETGRKKPIIPLMVFADIFDNLKNIIKSEQIPIFYTPHEAAFATKILIDRMKFLKKKNIVYQ